MSTFHLPIIPLRTNMKILCIALWFISGVSHVESDHSRGGWLMFMTAESNVTFNDLWHDSSYSEMNGQSSNISELIKRGVNFRSPLIDRMDEIQVEQMELVIFNAHGGYMGSYLILTDGYDPDLNDSYVFIDDDYLFHDLDLPWGPSVYIYNDMNMLSFMSLHMDSGIAGLNGEQFIVGVDETSDQLDNAVLVGCFQIDSPSDYGIVVASVFECTCYCLTQSGCSYIGLYWSATFETRCLVLDSKPTISTSECTGICLDETLCGLNTTVPPNYVNAEVYEVAQTLTDVLQQMNPENDLITPITVSIDFRSVIDSPDAIFINGFTVYGGGTFLLATWIDNCSAVLSDPSFMEDIEMYIKDNSGELATFEGNMFYLIPPTKFRCMYFNSTDNLAKIPVKLRKLTGEFLLASYIGLYGEWYQAECSTIEMMDRLDLIPNSYIHILDSILDDDFTNANIITTPMEYVLVIHASTNDSLNTWIKSVEISSSEAMGMSIAVSMECLHNATGPRNVTFRYEKQDATTSANFVPLTEMIQATLTPKYYFCRGYISIQLATINTSTVTSDTFGVRLRVFGCIVHSDLTTGAKCYIQNLIDTYMLSVTILRVPRNPKAYNALRPSGNGLNIVNFLDKTAIVITLHDMIDIEVTRVIINGKLWAAVVGFGGISNNGELNITGSQIVYHFNGVMDKIVYISDIIPLTGADLKIRVEIFACEFTSTETSTLTEVYPTAMMSLPVFSTLIPTVQSTPQMSLSSTGILPSESSMTESAVESTLTLSVSPTILNSNAGANVMTTTSHTTLSNTFTHSSEPTSNPALQSTSLPSTTEVVHGSLTSAFPNPVSKPASTTTQPTQVTPTDQTTELTPTDQTTQVTPTDQTTHVTPTDQTTQVIPTDQTTHVTHTDQTTQLTPTDQTTQLIHKDHTTPTVPTQNCICRNVTMITTEQELEEAVKDLQEKLTVPAKKTSAFKRTKISAPDKRTSSKVIGTAGVVTMVFVGVLVVAMDIGHIINAYNFIRALVRP